MAKGGEAIDEAGVDGEAFAFDDEGVGGDGGVFADGFNEPMADYDRALAEDGSGDGHDSGIANGDGRGVLGQGARAEKKERCDEFLHIGGGEAKVEDFRLPGVGVALWLGAGDWPGGLEGFNPTFAVELSFARNSGGRQR